MTSNRAWCLLALVVALLGAGLYLASSTTTSQDVCNYATYGDGAGHKWMECDQ